MTPPLRSIVNYSLYRIILFLILMPVSVAATTYYVAPIGHDANSGTSVATAFKTIQHAASKVQAGDQVIVRGGRYYGPIVINASGTPNNPISFSAYPGEKPTIFGSEQVSQWSVYNGEIYQSPMTSPIAYVVVDDQPMASAVSLPSMAEGQFFYDDSVLYIWCPGGGSPAARETGIIRYDTNPSGDVVAIYGDCVEFTGFTVKYAPHRCISVWQADNVKMQDCEVSYAAFHGIYVGKGFNCEVAGSQIHHNSLRNWPRGSSWSHDSGIAYYSGGNGIIKNNLVYLNNGEGLGCSAGWGEPGVAGLHVLQNTVYDNWSVNIWIDHGSDVVIDGNFVYVSGNQPFPELPKSTPAGILCAEEIGFGQSGYLKNGIITNNIVTGCREGFGFWYDNPGSGLKDFLVAHNTFVNNKNGAMIIETGIHTGARFLNNIFFQTNNILVTMAAPANVVYDYNSWYHQTNATGIEWNGGYYTYDQWRQISGEGNNSRWTKPGFAAGKKFGPNQFRLMSNSPCRDRGTIIATISRDYWGKPRPSGDASDIGAHEYRGLAVGPLFLLLGD